MSKIKRVIAYKIIEKKTGKFVCWIPAMDFIAPTDKQIVVKVRKGVYTS